MAPKKKVAGLIKLQIQAGQANPAPPIGPALGAHGVNIMEFCKAYNAATESQRGNVIPVEITVYEDRSFTFITKTPPAAELIKKAAGVPKGSATPHTVKVASLTQAQCVRSPSPRCPTSTPTTSRPPPRSSPAPPVPWASPSRPEALAGLPALSLNPHTNTVEGPRAARTPRLQGEADDQALQGLPRRG